MTRFPLIILMCIFFPQYLIDNAKWLFEGGSDADDDDDDTEEEGKTVAAISEEHDRDRDSDGDDVEVKQINSSKGKKELIFDIPNFRDSSQQPTYERTEIITSYSECPNPIKFQRSKSDNRGNRRRTRGAARANDLHCSDRLHRSRRRPIVPQTRE